MIDVKGDKRKKNVSEGLLKTEESINEHIF